MEIITELVQNQLMFIVPIGLAIIACILVFTYSIGPSRQPEFILSGLDDRKSAGKKKKLKEKKSSVNGHVTNGITKSEKSPSKELKRSPEHPKKEKKLETHPKELKKPELAKKSSESQELKKKSSKRPNLGKPVDFDEGDWETVPSKSDKKKKGEQAPSKKEKKIKPQPDVQLSVKEETPDKEEEEPVEEPKAVLEEKAEPVEEVAKTVEESVPVIEENQEKKKKIKINKPLRHEEAKELAEHAETASPKLVADPVNKSKDVPAAAPEPASTGVAFDELGSIFSGLVFLVGACLLYSVPKALTSLHHTCARLFLYMMLVPCFLLYIVPVPAFSMPAVPVPFSFCG